MEMKEKLYKEKVSENKATEIHYKMHEIKPIYWFSALIYSILSSSNKEARLWLL
jgi:hypothetical protein